MLNPSDPFVLYLRNKYSVVADLILKKGHLAHNRTHSDERFTQFKPSYQGRLHTLDIKR